MLPEVQVNSSSRSNELFKVGSSLCQCQVNSHKVGSILHPEQVNYFVNLIKSTLPQGQVKKVSRSGQNFLKVHLSLSVSYVRQVLFQVCYIL